MHCKTIMHSPPTRLYVDNTVDEAIRLLIERHMYNVPVVDRNEILVGEISVRHLIALLLPVSLSMERGLRNPSFMRETLEDLRDRLDRISGKPVGPHIATDISVVYPDSPLIDALMLLYNKYVRIPVVDRYSGRLVGGISFITLLRAIEELE